MSQCLEHFEKLKNSQRDCFKILKELSDLYINIKSEPEQKYWILESDAMQALPFQALDYHF